MLVLIVISEGVGMMLFNQVGDGGGTVWYHTIPSIDAIWAKAPFHRFIILFGLARPHELTYTKYP